VTGTPPRLGRARRLRSAGAASIGAARPPRCRGRGRSGRRAAGRRRGGDRLLASPSWAHLMPRAGGSTRGAKDGGAPWNGSTPGLWRAPLVSRRRSPALWRPAPRRVGERPRKDGERECAEVHEVHEVHERDGNPNVGLHRDADPSAARLAYRAVAGLEVLRLVPEGVTAASGRQLRLPESGGGDGPPLCSFSTEACVSIVVEQPACHKLDAFASTGARAPRRASAIEKPPELLLATTGTTGLTGRRERGWLCRWHRS
jgi:hypothetical protein